MILLFAPTLALAQTSLTLTGSCPGPMLLEVQGAPLSSVAVISADDPGGTQIPAGACAGRSLGITGNATNRRTLTTDASGYASFAAAAPAAACDLWLQAVDTTSCAMSSPTPMVAPVSAVTPSFTASTVRGIAPLGVFFDATGTTHTDGTVEPFHDLTYLWHYGDSDPYSGGPFATTGGPKNTFAGPLGAHVYDAPGTYEVTLTVRDGLGDTAQQTLQIIVDDPATLGTTWCFADVTGRGGDFAGCPLDSTGDGLCDLAMGNCVDTADVLSAVAGRVFPDTRLLFRRDDAFAMGNRLTLSTPGPLLIDDFGPGASKPVWTHTAAVRGVVYDNAADVRLVDVRIEAVGGGGNAIEHTDASGILTYRVDTDGFTLCGSTAFNAATFFSFHNLVVDQRCTNLGFSGHGGWSLRSDFESSAMIGIYLDDGIPAEGIVRTMHARKLLVAHNELHRAFSTKQMMSFRGCNGIAGGPSGICVADLPNEYLVVSDNVMETFEASVFQITPGGPHRDYLFERNFVTVDDTNPGTGIHNAFVTSAGERVSVRNNIVDLTDGSVQPGAEHLVRHDTGGPVWVYNNTLYSADADIVRLCRLPDDMNSACVNNLLYAPSAAGRTGLHSGSATDLANLLDVVDYTGNPFTGNDGAGTISVFPTPVEFALAPAGTVGMADPVDGGAAAGFPRWMGPDYFGQTRIDGAGVDVGAIERD